MRELSATYKIITPMFLGDGDQRATGIRPSSIKGALRFWWRALQWSTALQAAKGDESAALRWLHSREAALFGAAASDAGGGQGVFLMQVRSKAPNVAAQPFERVGPGQLYLLGQGLGSFKDGCTRSALLPNQSFDVLARFKPGTSIADTQEIVDTFKLFGLLGALGSRARHGMGSVALTALNVDGVASAVPDTKDQYVKVLSDLMGGANASGLPPFTAFSRHTKIDISSAAPDALRLLERVGATQQHYRLWGKDGKVNGQAARRLFKDDHDLMYKAAGGETIKTVPDRAVFGLPHNYFFSSSKKKADVNVRLSSGGKTEDTRRASPLLLHIHPFAGGTEFGAVHALLPALFLPQQGGIAVNRQREVLPIRPKWSVIYNYLTEYQTLHADPAFQNVLQGERLND